MYPHTIKHKHNHLIDFMSEEDDSERVLLEGANWKKLRFYQKSEALYQMTFVFCDRFLPKHGDRTVDQMVQAARSGKQNIIEGSEDGKTSTEMELETAQCGTLQHTRTTRGLQGLSALAQALAM